MVSAGGGSVLHAGRIASGMAHAVLLEHRLPDGSFHYDWMMERLPGSTLVTFRVGERIDLGEVVAFRATRLPDHRAVYLTYEGPVSGNRGDVRRLAQGDIAITRDDARGFEAQGVLGRARGTWSGRPVEGGGAYEVTFLGHPEPRG